MRCSILSLVVTLFSTLPSTLHAQTVPLPQKNDLPIRPESFCSGFTDVIKATPASFHKVIERICPAGIPSETLNKLIANPYRGGSQGSPNFHWIANPVEGRNVRVNFAFSISVPKDVVKAVLADDKTITLPYKSGALNLNTRFIDPPANNGEADATLATEQVAKCRSDRVNFDDTITHKMLLFKMHPNNFDFFVIARILNAPTEQTKESNMLIGYMPDPTSSERTVIFTVVDYLVNNRGYPAEVSNYIESYFLWYMKENYKFHINS